MEICTDSVPDRSRDLFVSFFAEKAAPLNVPAVEHTPAAANSPIMRDVLISFGKHKGKKCK